MNPKILVSGSAPSEQYDVERSASEDAQSSDVDEEPVREETEIAAGVKLDNVDQT